MQLHTTDVPAKALGHALSEAIATHDGDAVVLLSGGSALDVVEFINIPNRSECRTIFMMGDERWSREPNVNNTLQLQARYPGHNVITHLIETVPKENESLETFAPRIEKTFSEKISELKNVQILMLLGMGEDGHTAGIFPMSEELFQEVYGDDQTYVPVHVEGLTIDSRASFTPAWILDHVDQIFGYVVGESKHAMLESLVNETKKLNERPAELMKLHKAANLYTSLSI